MGDMGDAFRAMKADKKQRHADWYEQNLEILVASGIPFTDKGETLLFREGKGWRADFYPSTGRWKDLANNKMRGGGAEKFLLWVMGCEQKAALSLSLRLPVNLVQNERLKAYLYRKLPASWRWSVNRPDGTVE